MAIKNEVVRQAKKFLENKNLSIKCIKPRLFAKVSQDMNKSFDDLLNVISQKVTDGTTSSSDKKTD